MILALTVFLWGRKRKSTEVVTVKTVEIWETILAVCRERGDDWANAVQVRILHVHDLHAADAVYHILRKYIHAERTGNWELHLQAVSKMLPYLAASGHNNYTKFALIYLKQMSHLQDDHPKVYQHFQDGLHVIRRSDRYWAGLSSDLVIEQVLMRSMKTNGGLTRGRGMTEQQ